MCNIHSLAPCHTGKDVQLINYKNNGRFNTNDCNYIRVRIGDTLCINTHKLLFEKETNRQRHGES